MAPVGPDPVKPRWRLLAARSHRLEDETRVRFPKVICTTDVLPHRVTYLPFEGWASASTI